MYKKLHTVSVAFLLLSACAPMQANQIKSMPRTERFEFLD